MACIYTNFSNFRTYLGFWGKILKIIVSLFKTEGKKLLTLFPKTVTGSTSFSLASLPNFCIQFVAT